MPSFFHKPENALKRAKEFIDVDKKESALEVLNDVIRSRKHRQKWTIVHEQIMCQYTSLCVQLQRSSYAKDGLYQYRNICKEVAPSSFEKVIKGFLKLAEAKADEARQHSEATVLQGVEDLDVVVTPESLLLSTVSGEGAKERTDRVLLTPWVKFLWESYRNMLELLKNNLVNLSVYSDVAKDAFKFCLNYQRRMEFRKLCDILRNHLSQAEKYQSQQHSLKLDQPEVISGLVDVRFEQLQSSIAVDMWQEAFRAIEEIHKLLNMSGKTPKASLLENFYSRQAKVYIMAKNQLFHAAALHKLFVLRKEQKKTLTKDEAVITASQVLLATLSVPIEPVPSEADRFLEVDDNSRDKARRLAALLRMDTPPTRATLMRDMLSHEVLPLLGPELQQLYRYLEVDFDPLHLCSKVMPILESLETQEHLKQYVEFIREITLVRLIKQISQVYESIELSRLVELAPFATTTDLEKVVVETATSNNIQVRIDHSTKSLYFGMDTSFSHHVDSPEGPHVQSMPSEVLCNQLTTMSQALQQAVRIISASEIAAEHQASSKKACQTYQAHCRSDYRKTIQRGAEIEARKEFIENQRRALDKQKEDDRKFKLQKERSEEKKRLEKEAAQRDRERRKDELEEMQLKMKQEKVDALKNTAVGKKAFADITSEDLKHMDAEVIFSKQLKQIEKEKKDKEIKLKVQEKKVDYLERAKRLVELSLLEQHYEEQQLTDREFHVEQENQMIAEAITERKEGEEASVRLKVMRQDEAAFRKSLLERRKQKHEEQMVVFRSKLEKVRQERLAVRRKERKERRKAEEEEEAREAQAKREELERKREEEMKKREEEREEERLAAAKRVEYEEELLRKKERRALEESRRGTTAPDESDSSSWRRKNEPEPQESESRYPPQRSGGGGGGAYRPPNRGRDADQYDSPRRERRGWDDHDGGGGERWKRSDEDAPPPRKEEGDNWRVDRDRQPDRGGGRWGDDRGDDWKRGREEEPRRDDRYGGAPSSRGYGDGDRGVPRRGYDSDRSRGYGDGDRGGPPQSRGFDNRGDDRGGREERPWQRGGGGEDREERPWQRGGGGGGDESERPWQRGGGGGGDESDRRRDFGSDRNYSRDAERRRGDYDQGGTRDSYARSERAPARDYERDSGSRGSAGGGWGRSDGDRTWGDRDRGEGGGGGGDSKWRSGGGGDGGLKAGDGRGGGDRSPGRGRDLSPDGFVEVVNRRR